MDNVLTLDTLTAALRLAIPVAIAALGALIAERSGVLNLGLEGMMLSGAFAAYSTAEATGSTRTWTSRARGRCPAGKRSTRCCCT